MRYYELDEARRNPNLNQQSGFTKELHAYAAKFPDGFVSFTSLPKLGINPRSGFKTPLGIYAYPVEYVVQEIGDSPASGLPFAGEMPYANFFTIKGKIMDNDLTAGEERVIYNIILDKIPGSVVPITSERQDRYLTPFQRVWNAIKRLTTVKSAKPRNTPQFLSMLGVDIRTPLIAKYLNKKQITDDEYEEIAEFLIPYFERDDALDPEDFYDNDHFGDPNERLEKIFADAAKLSAARFRSTYSWNKVLRMLEYDAVVDHGQGVIHRAEPNQAVIVNPKAIANLRRVTNTRDDETTAYRRDVGDIIRQLSVAHRNGDAETFDRLSKSNPVAAREFNARLGK